MRIFDTRVPPPSPQDITNAFWHACRGGQLQTAEYLLGRGADAHWVGYDAKTPLQVADESGNRELSQWLRGLDPGHDAEARVVARDMLRHGFHGGFEIVVGRIDEQPLAENSCGISAGNSA